MRPGTSKLPPTGQPLPVGTATRLTTGLRQRLSTAAAAGSSSGTSALNTELSIEDRPITAQGLKTAPKGPQRWRRQVEDRAYFIGVLRGHINAITSELNTIVEQHDEAEKEAQSFVQYEKMAEALAVELRALQVRFRLECCTKSAHCWSRFDYFLEQRLQPMSKSFVSILKCINSIQKAS